MNSIGDGMVRFLSAGIQGRRLVTKTPEVRQIDNFFDFFPRAHLLILVRDGRAVVESRVKTFGESYQIAMRKWAEAVRIIRCFKEKDHGTRGKYLIVKYENLCEDVETELRRIFEFCDLPSDEYNFDSATDMPVRGSSVHHGENRSDVHWDPVKKTQGFNPTERWRHWGKSLHEQFNVIAGKEMEYLGYKLEQCDDSSLSWTITRSLLSSRNTLYYYFMYKPLIFLRNTARLNFLKGCL